MNRYLPVVFFLVCAAPAIAQQAPAPAESQTKTTSAIQQRDVFSGEHESAARIDNKPLDPSLAGFIEIPGTSSRIKPYGNAKLDVIHDFSPAGEEDAFITSTIPVDSTLSADNTSLSARQSKIGLEFRRPTKVGDLRVVYENDFYDFTTGKTQFNLRHFYGQVANVLAGFTYSTIMDPDAMPDTLDFEGPGSLLFVRQAGVRYTLALDAQKQHTLAFAIEDGKPDIVFDLPPPTPITVTPTSRWPDTHIRYRYEGESGHVQFDVVLRDVGGFADGLGEEHVFGIGASVAGSQQIGSDYILFQGTYGKGIARYIQDLTGLGADVGVDENGKLEANEAGSFYVAYQHYWKATLRSSFIYGYARVDSENKTFTTTFHDSTYTAANVIWNPADSSLNFGVELLWGEQELVTGATGDATRLQVSFQYDLVK